MAPLEKRHIIVLTSRLTVTVYLYWVYNLTCGWDESKDKFPWQGEEVHDVVAAGRHLLLPLFALLALLLIVIWRGRV